jgi:Xaa-Pro aminopeptidase
MPTRGLALEVTEVQTFLKDHKIDAWLIYDFRGQNAIAREIFSLGGHLLTRRWFYCIPQKGDPTLLAHRIEETNFPPLPGTMWLYAGLQELQSQLAKLLAGCRRIAMEYSPRGGVPTVSYVDAGMIELVREHVSEVVSSANLVQYFTCRWSDDQLASHKEAAEVLFHAQQSAFELIERELRKRNEISEYEVQQHIVKYYTDAGLISMSEPIVAVNANASNPHYAPSVSRSSMIHKNDVILIDLWGKRATPRAVYADITWMGFAGKQTPAKVQQVFNTVVSARDAGVEFLRQSFKRGETVQGYRVDDAVRNIIAKAGFGEYFFHRTGHSIGIEDHGNGVNIDGYETRDVRDIIPGVAFSIEPGVYLPEFGVRSELNVYFGKNGPEVFTTPQKQLTLLSV